MSWSASYKNLQDFTDDHREFESNAPEDQLDAARNAVGVILDSGAVGDPKKFDFRVNLSGHANPNHEITAGYANDAITVSVYQMKRENAANTDRNTT